jgi:hypothetical protein
MFFTQYHHNLASTILRRIGRAGGSVVYNRQVEGQVIQNAIHVPGFPSCPRFRWAEPKCLKTYQKYHDLDHVCSQLLMLKQIDTPRHLPVLLCAHGHRSIPQSRSCRPCASPARFSAAYAKPKPKL